ncbi:neuroendocrine convertase 2-like [Bombus fervidus]|uniref:neuroendocrine convertase 2-like n=1 Tax=Bombus fervidus TaxID=203811 RepID=UPI003D18B4DE
MCYQRTPRACHDATCDDRAPMRQQHCRGIVHKYVSRRKRQPAERNVVDRVAVMNGFVNLGPILGSPTGYHFMHKALPHASNRRSVLYLRSLKVNSLIQRLVQQTEFKSMKGGYRLLSVDNLVLPYQTRNQRNPGNRYLSNPFSQYQLYLKNTGQNVGKAKIKKAKIIEIRQINTSRIRAEGSDFLIDFKQVSFTGHRQDTIPVLQGPEEAGCPTDLGRPRSDTLEQLPPSECITSSGRHKES